MQLKPEFRISDVKIGRAIVRAYPFATIVSRDLAVTRMPCLVDEDADGLAVLGHVARADPLAGAVGGRLLLVFAAIDGYVSASWYASETIPTWNHVTLQLRGVAHP